MGIVDELRKLPPEQLAERVRRLEEEREAQAQAEAAAIERDYPRWAQNWRRAGWPRRHKDRVWSLRDEVCSEYQKRIHAIVAADGLGVVLGPAGVGKTHDVCRAALRVISGVNSFTVTYTTEADMHAAYVDAARGEGSIAKALAIGTEPDLLVIDEVLQRPREGGKSIVAWLLERVIDERYGDMKPTILIANGTRQDFAAGVGERIMSRIHEAGGCVEYPPDAENWRKRLGREQS